MRKPRHLWSSFRQCHCQRNISPTSGQDGGTGKYASLPRTTKRRTTAKTNQKCQKIELYESPTNKELKKKHSSRLVGVAEMGSQARAERMHSMAVAGGPVGGPGKSHICVRINQEENWGARLTSQPRVPAWETKASKSLAIKTCGSCGSGRSFQSHRRVCWQDP